MYEIQKVLVKRDKMSREEAFQYMKDTCPEFNDIINNNDYMATDDFLRENFGLEPDYLIDYINFFEDHCLQRNKTREET